MNGWQYNARGIQPSTGFWPSLAGVQQSPNGFLSTLGHGINTGIGSIFGGLKTGLGLLPQFNFGGQQSSGITPSAGGWKIDANGNLIGGDAPVTSTSVSAPPSVTVRPGPSPISHTTAIPGYAAIAMGDIRRRNQI